MDIHPSVAGFGHRKHTSARPLLAFDKPKLVLTFTFQDFQVVNDECAGLTVTTQDHHPGCLRIRLCTLQIKDPKRTIIRLIEVPNLSPE